MNDHWHDQIQRYVNGQSTAEEAIALEAALQHDAELRALYLDYMNLDVALGAAAKEATLTEGGTGRITTFPQPLVRWSSHSWRWLVATAACVALAALAVHHSQRKSPRTPPDLAAILSATQSHITRLSVEPPTLFPAWASPTASLLDPPRISQ